MTMIYGDFINGDSGFLCPRNMATWLVTGGCGFIGSHLVEALLKRGNRVRVLDDLSTGKRSNIPAGVDLRIGDVADERAVADALVGADGCFHLAAVASVQRCTEDWLSTHRTNLTGTITVFEKVRRNGAASPLPVVYASSAAVYGNNPQVPLKENATTSPISAYGADKLGCELHGKVAWEVHGVPNVGLRIFNAYGPRQDASSPYSGVIAIFADRVASNSALEIYGDGKQTRDFIYVGDVVAHFLAAMQDLRADARAFNVCTGRGITILELAESIGGLAGRRPDIRHRAPRTGDIQASVGDPTKAMSAFGLIDRVDMRDGLRKTLNGSG
jgi:UDP-glucose 4-epimerase